MSTKISADKYRERLTFILKIWLFVYTFLGTNVFLRESFIVTLCVWPMFLLAGILCIDRLIHLKNYIKTPYIFVLAAFCLSALISMLINRQYGFKENLITLILWCIYFFLLYTNDIRREKKKIIKECEVLGIILLVYMAVCTIIAFVMMFTGYSNRQIASDGYELFSGFSIGRLWGMFLNPNSAAVTACIAIILSVYFIFKNKHLIWRIVLVANILLQMFYIIFSDSRIGRVCLCALAGVLVMLKGLYALRGRKWFLKVVVILAAVAAAGIAFWIPGQVKQQYNVWVAERSIANESDDVKQQIEEEIKNNNYSAVKNNGSTNIIERGYDMSGDISNRRFDVWKSGLEIFMAEPVFGVSFRGMTEYALEHLPDTYLVNNDYKQMDTLDNEIMNILVSQGIVGIVLLIIFVVGVLVLVLPQMVRAKEDTDFWILCFAIVFILCISAMTVSTMFYNSTPNANCFWIFLGALVYLARKNKEDIKKEVK